MSHLQRGGMWLQVIVDPPGEYRGFHRRGPRLRQRFHPAVQVKTRGGDRTFGVNRATAILHAVADRPLVHIQSDVIHSLHGGASFGVSESASAEFSFCTPSAPPSTYALKLLVTYLDRDMELVWTPKHSDKMSWHRNSSVQIKPLQPTNSFFSANPATIRIDSLDFQSGRRSKREIVSESPSSERRLLWATS